MVLKNFFNLTALVIGILGFAQEFQRMDSVSLPASSPQELQANSANSLFYRDQQVIYQINRNAPPRSYKTTGFITQLDATNPLRVYAFVDYRDLVILDQHLVPIQSPIKLQDHSIVPLSLKVVDNQYLWLYNSLEENLVYYNYQLQKVILKSKNIAFKDDDQSITAIHSYKNQLFLLSQKTIYVYDDLGNFRTRIPFDARKTHQFLGKHLYYLNEENLERLDITTHEISSVQNFYSIKYFTMSPLQLFVLTDKVMYIYTRKTE